MTTSKNGQDIRDHAFRIVAALCLFGIFVLFAASFTRLLSDATTYDDAYFELKSSCWNLYGDYTNTEGIPIKCYKPLGLASPQVSLPLQVIEP